MLYDYYLWLKAIHIISIVTWMAGIFYLPRLFVYHSYEEVGSKTSETFKVMEYKLLKFIMTPSMIVAWIFGTLLVLAIDIDWSQGWFHVKLLMVILMSAFHGWCARQTRIFAHDKNQHNHKYFRIMNEVPTIIFLVIIIMVVVKPF